MKASMNYLFGKGSPVLNFITINLDSMIVTWFIYNYISVSAIASLSFGNLPLEANEKVVLSFHVSTIYMFSLKKTQLYSYILDGFESVLTCAAGQRDNEEALQFFFLN